MFKVNKGDFITTIECRSSDFIVNFEHIPQLFLVFLLFTLNIHYVFFYKVASHMSLVKQLIRKISKNFHEKSMMNFLIW